jgi:hypothetical protein
MDAVRLAQNWHEDHRQMHQDAEEDSPAWADCGVCAEMNPYYDDADREDV